jgi:indolepyruvate decarboxylase
LVKRFDAKIEFKEFVEKSGIPTTNFLMGTCLIDSELSNYLGSYYGKFKNHIAQEYLEETDCLIAIGPVYSDLNSYGFNLPYKINSHIAIYGTYTYIDGIKYDDIKMADILEELVKNIENNEFTFEKPIIGYEKTSKPNKKLTSEYIYPRMQEFLKENDILLAETGIIQHGLCQIKFPNNSEFYTQTLWGSIGWATPACLGVCIASPHSRVILFTGEGSHQISAMEVGTMLRYGVKPIILVLNNNGYTIERMLSNKPDDAFNDIMLMNYSKFTRAFEGDIWATRVHTEDEFDKALRVTQIMNKLCYIEICIDKMDVPDLSKRVIADFKHNVKKEANEAPKKTVLVHQELDIKKDKKVKFETTVHTSLKDIGE